MAWRTMTILNPRPMIGTASPPGRIEILLGMELTVYDLPEARQPRTQTPVKPEA